MHFNKIKKIIHCEIILLVLIRILYKKFTNLKINKILKIKNDDQSSRLHIQLLQEASRGKQLQRS